MQKGRKGIGRWENRRYSFVWKKCAGRKRARLAEKPYNGLSAEKQSKKKKANAKSDVQKSQ